MLCGMSMLDRQFLMDHRTVQEEEKMATWKRSGLSVCLWATGHDGGAERNHVYA